MVAQRANNTGRIRAADGPETWGTPTPIPYIHVKLAVSHTDNHLSPHHVVEGLLSDPLLSEYLVHLKP